MLDQEAAKKEFAKRENRYLRANRHMKEVIEGLLDDLGSAYGVRDGFAVVGSPKDFDSFYRKATQKYNCEEIDEAFAKVRDLSRLRVVCHTVDDCYKLVDLLQDASEVVYVNPATIDDYIAVPRETGYRAIHLEASIDVPDGKTPVSTPVEIQIRSALQEAWGNYTHADFYRDDDPERNPLVRGLMRELSDLLHWSDRHAARLVKEMAADEPKCEPQTDAGG